jgi:hypothetical protein
MAAIQWTDVEARLKWEATTEEYDRIRTVWLKHCDTELKQDMEGLLSTLTDDCVYTVLRTNAPSAAGQRWEGQEGARAFYTALFQAFPDQNWQPEAVVIGPQGVFSAVVLNARQVAPWPGSRRQGKLSPSECSSISSGRPTRASSLARSCISPQSPSSGAAAAADQGAPKGIR